MKCLLLLAVVLGVAKAWEPTDGVDNKCMMCGDPTIRTYGGQYMYFDFLDKFAFTGYKAEVADDCKWEVDCVSSNKWLIPGNIGKTFVDWCGVAFWTHSNPDKFFRNYLLGQSVKCVGVRGQGFSGMVGKSPINLQFPMAGENMNNWDSDVRRVPPNCTSAYTLNVRNGNQLALRSNCGCGWALDFYPAGRETCVVAWSEAGKRAGNMTGPCGPMTGNGADDWVMKNGTASNSGQAIMSSYRGFENDGQSYVGGTKHINVCTAAGLHP